MGLGLVIGDWIKSLWILVMSFVGWFFGLGLVRNMGFIFVLGLGLVLVTRVKIRVFCVKEKVVCVGERWRRLLRCMNRD